MSYLEQIGKNAKKAFEDLKDVKHKKIKKVLDSYNQSLKKNANKIIKENLKDVKNVKRKNLVDRLILDQNNTQLARGLSSFSSAEIDKIKGKQSKEIESILGYLSKTEVIHKDDMVLL